MTRFAAPTTVGDLMAVLPIVLAAPGYHGSIARAGRVSDDNRRMR